MRILIGLLLWAGIAQSWAEPLQVKPGLWEVTTQSTIRSSGMPDSIKLDKMTSEKRAQVEKMLAERDKPRTSTVRSCLRKEQIDSGSGFTGGQHHQGCTQKEGLRTAHEWTTDLECSGRANVAGRIQVKAPDAAHMNLHIEMKTVVGKVERVTTSEVTSKWLGADCSSLTPPPAKK